MTCCFMSTRSPSTRAAQVGGRPLARAGVLALLALTSLLMPPARAQTVTWEQLPLVYTDLNQRVRAVDFLRGEGAAADDPAADSLVLFHQSGVFLYNPAGAAGAGDNGINDPWYKLCRGVFCGGKAGLVTAANSLLVSNGVLQSSRATRRGRDWAYGYDDLRREPYIQLQRAHPVGAVLAGIGDGGETARSLQDGAPGTWEQVGTGPGFPQSLGEVPPSPMLPDGRVLYGVWNGILTSDDGGLSYQPSSAYGQARYIVWSFTFVDVPGHPYGGVAYAGVQNLNEAEGGGEARGAEALRSDDGGTTWVRVHRFNAYDMDLPVPLNTDVTEVIVYATPDGALWAGVGQSAGATNPPRAGIMRSTDGGATWARADSRFRGQGRFGPMPFQFKLSRTGVLYAATWVGAWRTTAAVVAGEASPSGVSEPLGVTVRPNPAGGRVEVVLTTAEASSARVVVIDALGREVAVVLDAHLASGERVVGMDTASWPAGVYVVRATAAGNGGAQTATARLVVAR